jgi:hypothetical protein
MTSHTTKPDSSQLASEKAVDLFDNWFDPIETEVRARAREFIEELIRGELDAALARPRYQRGKKAADEGRSGVCGHRHGSRTRSLFSTVAGRRSALVIVPLLHRDAGGLQQKKSQPSERYAPVQGADSPEPSGLERNAELARRRRQKQCRQSSHLAPPGRWTNRPESFA